jgi:hypothetical protein
MRWATDGLAGLQGQAVAKDRARTTKRVFGDLLDDPRAGLDR